MLRLVTPVNTYRTMESDSHHHQNIGDQLTKKPRLLCLHSFRTSGEILKKQLDRWPTSVRQKLDLVFPNGPFPAQGKSELEGIYDPPYYEWFQFNKDFTTCANFDKCLEYIEECMMEHGPFDGVLGFSQGAVLTAALPGLQAQGVTLTKVSKIKSVIIIGGGKFEYAYWNKQAYNSPIKCPSLHFLGKRDYMRPYGEELLKYAVDPFVIRHPKGHTVPRIDDQTTLSTVLSFLDKVQKMISAEEEEKKKKKTQLSSIV